MKLYQIDAFTDQPFKGNPAVVCLHDGSLTEQRMQEIAREVNQSESSFLLRPFLFLLRPFIQPLVVVRPS